MKALPLLFAAAACAADPPLISFDCSAGCLDRSNYSIKAIVHGTSDDPFWQHVQSAAMQAAADMNVELDMQLYDAGDSGEDLSSRMAADIRKYVADTEDGDKGGLLVTIPNEAVSNA